MDVFLQHLNQSISAVDVQLDFEKLVSRVRKAIGSQTLQEVVLSEVGAFLDAHQGLPRHIDFMIETIWSAMIEGKQGSHHSELMELLLRVLTENGGWGLLIQLTENGRELLKMLNSEDAFVRLHLLRILKGAISHDNGRLVESLLGSPEILAEVVDMCRVNNSSEFLRNEALSLLVQVSGDVNPDLAPILAYQGMADCVFDILMESESGVTENEVSEQAIQCLRNLCSHEQCSRYIRETGGCMHVAEFLEYALAPVLDHAQGIATEEVEEDPESLQKRIDAGWKQCEKILGIADILMADMEQASMKQVFFTSGAVATMVTVGESLYLSPEARSCCYLFVAHVVEGNEQGAELLISRKDPIMWSIFPQMMAERTPLVVRFGIDAIVRAMCGASQAVQHSLISTLSMVADLEQVEEEEGGQDPPDLYLEESPGRIVRGVLIHACDNVKCRIPDTSPLAEQVWFSLRTVSHIFFNNLEVMHSASVLKITQTTTLPQLLVHLAKNPLIFPPEDDDHHFPTVVLTACARLLAEFIVAVPNLASLVSADIQLLKLLLDVAAASSTNEPVPRGVAATLLSVLLSSTETNHDDHFSAIISAVAARMGLAKLDTEFNQLRSGCKKSNSRTQNFLSQRPLCAKLPTVADGFQSFLSAIASRVRLGILNEMLGPRADEGERRLHAFIRSQQERILELEAELATTKRALVDVELLFKGGSAHVLERNLKLESLVDQLGKEVRASETEIKRISVMKETEVSTLRSLLEELQQQVQALSLSNSQFSLLGGPVR